MKAAVLKHSSDIEFKLSSAHQLVYIKKVVTEDVSENIRTNLVQIMPGGQLNPHTHDTLEVFYIISGHGLALVNDQWIECGPGDVIYAPAGEKHGLKNTGEDTIELVANFPNHRS